VRYYHFGRRLSVIVPESGFRNPIPQESPRAGCDGFDFDEILVVNGMPCRHK
jgi:hypothetical protein